MRTTRKTAAALALAAPLAVGTVAAPSLAFADTTADTAVPAVASASSASPETGADSIESLEKQLETIYDRHSDLWDKVVEEAFADLDEGGPGIAIDIDEGDPSEEAPAADEDEDFSIGGDPEDGDADDLLILEGPDADEKALVDASTSLTQEEKATLHKDIDEADAIWERLVTLDKQQDGDVEETEEANKTSAPQEADNA